MAFSFQILWSNPILLRYFTKIAPSVLPCPKTQEHQSTCVDLWVHRVPENGHQPLGRGNSLWRSAFQYCDPTLTCYAISRRSPPVYFLALRLRNTKVPVWTHESIGYPKMDIRYWDAAIHYGVQLVHYSDPTLCCYAISRRLPPLFSLAPRRRNTKVPVWTHESIGYPKMDISQWDAAIHYGVQLNQYCEDSILWSNPIFQRYFTEIAPCVLPCLKTQEHQSTCVDSWVHRVPENGHQILGRRNSLWRSACPI